MPQDANDFDLHAWLADISKDGSLNQETVKNLGTILEPVKSKLRDQFLMRGDYTRKTQELADRSRQVETDVNEILKERQDLANWKNGVDAKLSKAYADLDSDRTTAAQFRARIQTIADQNGLDPAELLQGLSAATTATKTAATETATNTGNGAGTVDASKFVSSDDFMNFARRSPLLNAEVEDIFSEHLELTGKPLKYEYKDSTGRVHTGRKALLIKAAEHNARSGNQSMSVRDIWEQDYKIPEVRQQQLVDSIRAEERGKLDAEYKTKLSESMLAGGTPGRTTPLPDRPKSVLFDEKRDQRTPAERETAAASGGDNGHNVPPPTSAAHDNTRWMKYGQGFLDRRAHNVPLGQDVPAGKTGL